MKARDSIKSEWASKVDQWLQSGKSAKAWCKENNVVYTTFLGWCHKLKDSHQESRSLNKSSNEKFIELKDSTQNSSGVCLEYNNLLIHLDADFNTLTLKKCLDVLRGAKC